MPIIVHIFRYELFRQFVNKNYDFILEINSFWTFFHISSILLLTVVLDKGIDCNFFEYCWPNITRQMSITAGIMRFSTIVCGFLFFAICNHTIYEARNALSALVIVLLIHFFCWMYSVFYLWNILMVYWYHLGVWSWNVFLISMVSYIHLTTFLSIGHIKVESIHSRRQRNHILNKNRNIFDLLFSYYWMVESVESLVVSVSTILLVLIKYLSISMNNYLLNAFWSINLDEFNQITNKWKYLKSSIQLINE
jgi:hypothetical protein